MGRGLSELQRSILRLALHNRTAEGLEPILDRPPRGGADVYAWEVLESAYGFREHRRLDWSGKPAETRYGSSSGNFAGHRKPGGEPLFSRSAIGPRRYNAAHVAVSKAFYRLQERGLAKGFIFGGKAAGLKLTAEGVEMAERLSANHEATLPHA
jgi:hypothetical protein